MKAIGMEKNKSKRRGFTLVEVIVVLICLALLAAILIPTLVHYIDDAKEKAIIGETRQAVMAAQSLVSENYGLGRPDLLPTVFKPLVKELSEVPGNITYVFSAAGRLEHLVYAKAGMHCVYCRDASVNSPCSSCQGKDHYTVNGPAPSDYVKQVMEGLPHLDVSGVTGGSLIGYFNSGALHDRSIDSTSINGTNYPKVKAILAEAGFDVLSGSWSLIKSEPNTATPNPNKPNYRIFYTPDDITKKNVGDSVAVMVYVPPDTSEDPDAKGTYYTGTSTVQLRKLNGVNSHILSWVDPNDLTPLPEEEEEP